MIVDQQTLLLERPRTAYGGSNHRQPLFNVCFALEAIGYFLCSTVDNLLLFELTSVCLLSFFSVDLTRNLFTWRLLNATL